MIDGLIFALLQLGHFTSHYIKFWSSIYPYVTAFFNLVLQELRSFTKGLISHYENRLFLEILNATQKEQNGAGLILILGARLPCTQFACKSKHI